MSWLYWYTKYKQYRDPRMAVGSAIARIDPAAADVYKLSNLAVSADDIAKFVSYTVQNNIMTADDWAAILDVTQVSPGFALSVLSSPYLLPDIAADIIKSPQLSADKTQAVLYAMPFSDLLVYILTRGAASVTLGANAAFRGVNRFYTLDLGGYTYIADGQPHVIIAKQINIPPASKLVKTPTGGAGGGATNPLAGGSGGGGLIIICSRLDNAGEISANGDDGKSVTSYTSALRNGYGGGDGVFALVGTDTVGNGGRGSDDAYGGAGNRNGGGGGAGRYVSSTTIYYYGGAGGSSSIISYSSYAELAEAVKRAAVDWVLVNVFGKRPTTVTQFPNVYGSGGGEGAYASSWTNGGGGGGGGGEVIILTVNFNNGGSIRANGGGGGGNAGAPAIGGGGGGGGVVYVLYKIMASLGILSAQGGPGGIGSSGWNGQPGSPGTAKAVAI